MLFARTHTEKKKTLLCIDIGSSRIMSAYVELEENKKPMLTATAREELPCEEAFDSTHYLRFVRAGIEHTLATLVPKAAHPLDGIYVTLSPLLYVHQTRRVQVTYSEHAVVTKKMLEDLTHKEVALFKEETGHTVLLDQKIMEVRINGYRVDEPEGKKAHCIDLHLYISATDETTQEIITTAIEKATHKREFGMYAYSFAVFRALHYIFPSSHYLSIETEGEITNVQYIKDGIIAAASSFPYGKNTLLRRVMQEKKMSALTAGSFLRLALANDGHLSMQALERPLLEEEAARWGTLTKQVTAELMKNHLTLPALILLVEDKTTPFFSLALEKSNLLQAPQGARHPTLHLLTASSLTGYCTFEGDAQRENFFMLAVLFSATL